MAVHAAPVSQPDRLVIAFAAQPIVHPNPRSGCRVRAYLAWKERSPPYVGVRASSARDVTTSTDAYSVLGLSVTPEFFRTMGVGPFLAHAACRR
jgi:hypothetical protein